jgi:glycosyltransferase involved in cell wall biosynthesis
VHGAKPKPRLIVVSPYLDKRHGTERRVTEWISRLADRFEIHVYSQRVEDIDFDKITWHRIPKLPGPHLFNYIWWFIANHAWRSWQRRFRGIHPDIVFSPGINCFDADVVSVHIVFAEFLRQTAHELEFRRNPVRFWPRLLHRKLYYGLIIYLEGRIYTKTTHPTLILIARKTAADLARFYGREQQHFVLYIGLDHHVFNPLRRAELREAARAELELTRETFAILLVGNDFHKKGASVLLDAVSRARDLPLVLLIAGNDDPGPFESMARTKAIRDRVCFLPPRKDVEFYYAAADAYAGPSLEDTFAQPPAEAMACGLPVIVSSTNGTSEIITNGVDGLILQDAMDARSLASMIRKLYEDEPFRTQLGANAAITARKYTWERNASELNEILKEVLRKKSEAPAETLAQES